MKMAGKRITVPRSWDPPGPAPVERLAYINAAEGRVLDKRNDKIMARKKKFGIRSYLTSDKFSPSPSGGGSTFGAGGTASGSFTSGGATTNFNTGSQKAPTAGYMAGFNPKGPLNVIQQANLKKRQAAVKAAQAAKKKVVVEPVPKKAPTIYRKTIFGTPRSIIGIHRPSRPFGITPGWSITGGRNTGSPQVNRTNKGSGLAPGMSNFGATRR